MLTNTGEEEEGDRRGREEHRQVEEQRPKRRGNREGGRGENKHKEAKEDDKNNRGEYQGVTHTNTGCIDRYKHAHKVI